MTIFAMVESLRMFFLISLVATATASAHLGHSNEIDVHVFPERMRLVFRTSLPFAWSLLGDQTLQLDDAGKTAVIPQLAAAAPALFAVTQNGVPMAAVKAEGIFEPNDHFAFVLNFERPVKWPVTIEALYFKSVDQLETNTIAVFDKSVSRFARDIEPLLQQEIGRGRPAISFSLAAAKDAKTPTAVVAAVATSTVLPEASAPLPSNWLAVAAVGCLLAWRMKKWMA